MIDGGILLEFRALNPATEKTEKTYNGHSKKQAEAKILSAAKAQEEWKNTSFKSRSRFMKRAAGTLRKKKKKYAELMTREMGKPITQSLGEIEKCAWACDYYAESAEKHLRSEKIKTEARETYVSYEPLGVVMAVMPWNFPYWQVFRFAAPDLMAGNAGILKHSSNVPGCALAIEEIFLEAGFPKGLFGTLLVDSKTASSLIENKNIAAVTVTGSTGAGSKVAETAGRNIKKTVLELGGSDPFIVLDDVNVKTCAQQAVRGRLINAGQSCIAAKRFIVSKKIHKKFEEEFVERMKAQVVGDPMEKETEIGPLARRDLMEDLLRQIRASKKMGARVLCGGKRRGTKGYFVEPTVLGSVTRKMPVFSEETFGPAAAVIPAKSDMEAAELANATPYGLGASVWSKSVARAKKLVPKINAGAVFVNKIVASDPRVPFGGVKKSGYGRELGRHGILEFMNAKSVVVG